MSTEFNNYSLINLEKLFLNDRLEILRLKQEFERYGWCFVQLSQDIDFFNAQINQINQSFSNFFALKQNEKTRYLSSNALGYTRMDQREGIKILTDQHGNTESQYMLPMNIDATLQQISQLIGDLTYRLKPIITKLIQSNDETTKQVEISNLSMLDIVRYFNEKPSPTKIPDIGYNIDENNYISHYDLGLFSLTILSTCDGLQLKDQQQDKWIDGPNNSLIDQSQIGVIWLGEAANILSENRFKAAIYRIIYPRTPYQIRLTICQEVCTENQIKQLLQYDRTIQRLPTRTKGTLRNQSNSKPMTTLPNGETQRHLSKSRSNRSDMKVYPKSIEKPNNRIINSTTEENHSLQMKNKK